MIESDYYRAPSDMSMATYLDLPRLTRLAATIYRLNQGQQLAACWLSCIKPDHVGYSQAALGMGASRQRHRARVVLDEPVLRQQPTPYRERASGHVNPGRLIVWMYRVLLLFHIGATLCTSRYLLYGSSRSLWDLGLQGYGCHAITPSYTANSMSLRLN